MLEFQRPWPPETAAVSGGGGGCCNSWTLADQGHIAAETETDDPGRLGATPGSKSPGNRLPDNMIADSGGEGPDQNARKVHVAVLCRDLDHQGGVVSFCRMLLSNLPPRVAAHQVVVGSAPRDRSLLSKLCRVIARILRFGRECLKRDIDVFHLNTSLVPRALVRDFFYVLLLRVTGRSARAVLSFHGWDWETFRRIKASALWRRVFLSQVRSTGKVVVLAESFRSALVAIGVPAVDVSVMHTMYDQGDLECEPAGARVQRSTFTVLFMSRFVQQKGGVEAIEIAAEICRSGAQSVEFAFVGDGPARRSMEDAARQRGIEDRCRFPGYLTGRAKAAALRDADVFLFPTFYPEGCPIVVVEAMASGLPVLSTRQGAIPELIQDGVSGFLFDPTDRAGFVGAVQELLANESRRTEMGEAGREVAQAQLEAGVVAERLARIYRSLDGPSRAFPPE